MHQIFPIALGRDGSQKELHIWDPECGLGQTRYAEITEVQMECRWGAGLIEEEAALILYLFDGDRTMEVYFPQQIAVGPEREMNSWDVLLSMLPESLVLVYGEKPANPKHWLKVTFKEPVHLMQSLEDFVQRILNLGKDSNTDPALKIMTDYFIQITGDCEAACL